MEILSWVMFICMTVIFVLLTTIAVVIVYDLIKERFFNK